MYLHSPVVSPCSQTWAFFSIPVDYDVRSPEVKANNRLDKTRRPACPWRENASRQKENLENQWLALLPWKRQHVKAETIKANKNWKVIAYLLFPQLDTFPQGIWSLFCLTAESFYLFNSLFTHWQADSNQAAGADSSRYGLLGFLLFVFHLSTL